MRKRTPALLLAGAALVWAGPAAAEKVPVTLSGSPASMVRQNSVAKDADYTFLRTAGQIAEYTEKGRLVPVESTSDVLVVDGVSHPVARPEMAMFIRRLGEQYRAGCGERLVVTSLTRAADSQPSNSHALSVHPTGMAADFRISENAACRAWLEGTLLKLESDELLDVTRERHPPHYHVAVFPEAYSAHVEAQLAREMEAAPAPVAEAPKTAPASLPAAAVRTLLAQPAPQPAEAPTPPWALAVAGTLVLAVALLMRRRAAR